MKAFPYKDKYNEYVHQGMDLRDYFAAKAMQGVLTLDPDTLYRIFSTTNKTLPDAVAEQSYRFADAMLKVREAK